MKKYIIHLTSLLLIVFTIFTSCEKGMDINRDPDLIAPEDIPMAKELPAAITGIGASAGSYFALAGGFWSQYWTQSAVANQYKQIDDYSMGSNDNIINGAWNSMYDALTDVRNIKKNAENAENWKYYLIATSLEVYASQILVDFYGAIPYDEANDPSNLNPHFNTPEEIYDQMASSLKDALSKDLSLSPIEDVPGGTDLIFSGDMDRWTEFANTLLLKIYLRQTEIRPSVAQQGILELYANGADFLNADAAITQFSDEANKSNPLYETDRRQLNVATNLRASYTLGSFLTENTDTRRPFLYNGTTYQYQGNYVDGSSNTSVVVLNAVDPVYFISRAESYFLQAEADVRYNGGSNAKNLYNIGVLSAFDQFDLDGSLFIASEGAYEYPSSSVSANIKAIITQKWISFFPGKGYESFIEQNRTGYPSISNIGQDDPSYVPGEFSYSIEGVTGGLFPKRFEYPNQELQRNINSPTTLPSITDRVWYDVAD